MKKVVVKNVLAPAGREAALEYLYDMIAQMARLARRAGDLHAAIHLEAIITAQHAAAKDQWTFRRPSSLRSPPETREL